MDSFGENNESLQNATNETEMSLLFDGEDDLLRDCGEPSVPDRDETREGLRHDAPFEGFDTTVGHNWIYPLNNPIRSYQRTICKSALFNNTLVVLPTGLGKTFIAAVVMYNIFRWYPRAKIIFMAPTRPLVSQQIDACSRVMGFPQSATCELTGRTPHHRRSTLWQTKRVFYATPQVVLADLTAPDQSFPTADVRLVVIDEAHKAKGRYAYTQIVRLLADANANFRVLALSATPGRTLEDVAEVVRNLLIAHIEVRSENSIDVQQYTFQRNMHTIVIPLGETIQRVRNRLLDLIDPYMSRLRNENVLSCASRTLTRGSLILDLNRFQRASMVQRHPNHSAINSDFRICVSLYHAVELLVRYGVHTFLNFFDNHGQERYYMASDQQIRQFIAGLRQEFRVARENEHLGNDVSEYGHPKYRILERELVQFFQNNPQSKVIVFCEFRDSVATINRLLTNNQPLIRAKSIVGQGGAGQLRPVTQQEQIATMRAFRAGECNTLIATCVVEEGIDVGQVDLIVCFDISKNPSRYVQRIGRTGRRRIGRVLMLVTEGEEHATFKQVMATKNRINQQLTNRHYMQSVLCRQSPRLVPPEFNPTCAEMFMSVPKEDDPDAVTTRDEMDETQQNENEPSTSARKTKRTRNREIGSDADDTEEQGMENQPSTSGRKTKRTRNREIGSDANEPGPKPTPKRGKPKETGLQDVREVFKRQALKKPLTALEQKMQLLRQVLNESQHMHRLLMVTIPETIPDVLRVPRNPNFKLKAVDPLELSDVGWVEQEPEPKPETESEPAPAKPPTPAPTQLTAEEIAICSMFHDSSTLDPMPTRENEEPSGTPVRVEQEALPTRPVSCQEMEASIGNMFDDSITLDAVLNPLPNSTSTPAAVRRDIQRVVKDSTPSTSGPSTSRPSALKAEEHKQTAPGVAECKRENEPVRTPSKNAAYQRMLKFFHLRSVEDIFDDESPEQPSCSKELPASGGAARKQLPFASSAEPSEPVPLSPHKPNDLLSQELFDWTDSESDTEKEGQRSVAPPVPADLPAGMDLSPSFVQSSPSPVPALEDSAIGVGQVRRNRQIAFSDSSESEAFESPRKRIERNATPPPSTTAIRRDKPLARGYFLQTQAVVDGDDSEEDDDAQAASNSIKCFVISDTDDDEQAQDASSVDMHAIYLQSVPRTQVGRAGAFKIPTLPANVGRQQTYLMDDDSDESDSEMDSFITDKTVIVDTEPTELERAEQRLRERRQARRNAAVGVVKRYRRIQALSDSE